MTTKTKEPKLICAYCLKHIKLPAYSLKLDLDLPKIYFCNEIEAALWLTQAIAKIASPPLAADFCRFFSSFEYNFAGESDVVTSAI